MTSRFSNFNSISYTEDYQELQVTGTKCRLPDMMSGTDEILISGAVVYTIHLLKTLMLHSLSYFVILFFIANHDGAGWSRCDPTGI